MLGMHWIGLEEAVSVSEMELNEFSLFDYVQFQAIFVLSTNEKCLKSVSSGKSFASLLYRNHWF